MFKRPTTFGFCNLGFLNVDEDCIRAEEFLLFIYFLAQETLPTNPAQQEHWDV